MGAANILLKSAYDNEYIRGVPNSKNCSGFLKSLGQSNSLNFNVPNKTADELIDHFNQLTANGNLISVWEKLGTGKAGMEIAIKNTRQGRLVIAAMKAKDYYGTDENNNGHVAILLPKLEGPHAAPLMYGGGNSAATSKGDKTIRQVWNPDKHEKLQFFMLRTAFLGQYD